MRVSRQVLEQALDEPELARATLCLGGGLLYQGEFNAAEPELRRALSLYKELTDQEGQLDSLIALGTAKARQGRPVEALELFLQVRHLHVTLGNVEGEIRALNSIGAVYGIMGDHPNAVHYLLLVLGLGRQHGLPLMEQHALSNLSMAYNEMGQHHDALEAATACLKIQAENSLPALEAAALQNAGQAHFGLQQFPEAQAMYLKASKLIEHSGNQSDLTGTDLFLGRVAQQQGNLDGARQIFERCLKIYQKIGDDYGQVTALMHLGELLGTTGQVDDALSALIRARSLAESGQLRDKLCEIDLALSKLYRDSGRPYEALTHLEQHLQLRGELFNAESDQRLQSLRVQFELEQAERERLATQRQNAELTELNARLEATNRDLTAAQTRTAELMARLEQHANEDALTGLPNRRAFDAALDRVSRSQQISVVLCDIDHFKAVNDRFSHLVGDEVLRHVAALLRGQLHRGDLLARYGGEEFVLLLTGASEAATLELCEDLRRATENHDWSTVRPGLSLTISLGVAVAQLNPATLAVQDVMQSADDALYAAKNAGRNRVEIRQVKPSAG
ncbi:diguanylate cyclase/phosphodiesterase (GGDEF & EAL domains) with PAS/PAC sensor(s) [Deinococcus marmoris]|uniref:Diguanylate cyclase/phosphodiesterase (GGDEF & EAL domains) with PAS/PAC sensor(S) n=1 Tax=Deinococcus marmoris TaxID=249408 RepID=A0A1U7NT66_9DEIO|nr:diguanylate cyclase/phosphodiesterase (GGDEF & EAL domains) with PAS/PAC sensor(s) [Deinococcus marmoris]